LSSARSGSRGLTKPVLEAKNVTFAYAGSTTPALRNISLTIDAGEFILIAGPSGCGKSTLLRCLAGFVPQEFAGAYQGAVSVMGRDASTHPIHELARMVSLVQQDPDGQIVTLGVDDEIAFGPENFQVSPREILRRAKWALDATDAAHLSTRSTLTLSGGEKQKVVLAAFLAVKAPVLLFDEPTARLDPPSARNLVAILHELSRAHRATIVIVEHRVHYFLPFVTRCLLMSAGRLVYDGLPSSVEKRQPMLRRLGVSSSPLKHQRAPSQLSSRRRRASLLEVEDLTFSYPPSAQSTQVTPALRNVFFAIAPGETVALMGPNGSGKSTLLYNLIGLLRPDRGTIRLAGRSIHNQPVSRLAGEIGFVFQNPLHQLFERTVWDELLLASRQLGRPSPAVAAFRAKTLAERFQLDAYLGHSPFALSLGEQRRLTIASILIHRPHLILLDEPFIGQDYGNVSRLMTLVMRAVQEGASLILATHDPALAETCCRRLLFLDKGQLLLDAPLPQGFNELERRGEGQYAPSWHPPTRRREVPSQR
jgi:energy-coupling factor transporter ATP-binding protein EcfA2